MQCIVPSCDVVTSTSTALGVTFHTFPTEPVLRETWLRSLGLQGWDLLEKHVVCSKHFLEEDLVVCTDGQCSVRTGATPVVCFQNAFKKENCVKSSELVICRICFTTDGNLHPMAEYKNLDQSYKILTGFPKDNEKLPPYLCMECSHRLQNCIQFKNKTIKANLILLEIVQKHKYLTLDTIRTASAFPLLSSSLITHRQTNHYDLEIVHVERKNVYAGKRRDVENSSCLYNTNVKVEKDEMLNQDRTYDSVSPPRLHEAIITGIKLEEDDAYNQDSLNHENIIEYKENLTSSHDTTGIKIKMEKIEITNQDSVDDVYTSHDDHISLGEISAGEDYSSDDGLFVRKPELGDNLNRKVKKLTQVSKHFNQTSCDQHWKPMSESHDILIINDKLYSSIHSPQSHNEITDQNHIESLTEKDSIYCKKELRDSKDTENLNSPDAINPFEDTSQKYSCEICQKSFVQKDNLLLHLRVHSGVKSHSCEVCNSTFVTKHRLLVHMRTHSGERPYKCGVCEKSFSQMGSLTKHKRIHSGEKPYSCTLCVKSFRQKNHLDTHLTIHSKEKRYVCKFCKKTFKQLRDLNTHLRTHSGEPYSCDVCGQAFSQRCNLISHARTHSDNKPYSCNVCDKVFDRKGTLNTHIKTHTDEKPYLCLLCSKAFRRKHQLKTHFNVHSGEKPLGVNIQDLSDNI